MSDFDQAETLFKAGAIANVDITDSGTVVDENGEPPAKAAA